MGFHFARPFMTGGSLGVDVFFVLSGWLITSILVAEFEQSGAVDYKAFVLRRVRRLLPALAVLLIAMACLIPLFLPEMAHRLWLDLATAAFFVTNLRQTFWPAESPLSHTWSLAIEEQFYLLWPLAIPLLMKLSRRSAGQLLLAIWAALTLSRLTFSLAIPLHPATYYFTPFHATGLLLGAALALHPLRLRGGSLALVVLIALFVLGNTTRSFIVVQPLAELLTVAILAHPPRVLAVAPLRYLGRISYAVYLWHIPLAWLMPPRSIGDAMVLFAVSIMAGTLSYYLIERRFLHKGKTRAAAVPGGAISEAG